MYLVRLLVFFFLESTCCRNVNVSRLECHAVCENNDDLWVVIISLLRNSYSFPITGCDNYMVHTVWLNWHTIGISKQRIPVSERSNKTDRVLLCLKVEKKVLLGFIVFHLQQWLNISETVVIFQKYRCWHSESRPANFGKRCSSRNPYYLHNTDKKRGLASILSVRLVFTILNLQQE